MGAFLKFGKLAFAEPCPTYMCGKPSMHYNKKFCLRNREWNDIFYDPGTPETLNEMDDIAKELNQKLLDDPKMFDCGANGVFVKSMKPSDCSDYDSNSNTDSNLDSDEDSDSNSNSDSGSDSDSDSDSGSDSGSDSDSGSGRKKREIKSSNIEVETQISIKYDIGSVNQSMESLINDAFSNEDGNNASILSGKRIVPDKTLNKMTLTLIAHP